MSAGVIFRDESGNATDAQLAFEDTWHAWSIGRSGKGCRHPSQMSGTRHP